MEDQRAVHGKTDEKVAQKATRLRSPAYPGINLELALKRAGELYAQDKMNPVPIKIAVKRWGFAEKSSGGLVTTAALKAFGLLNDIGSGKDRKVQLTDEARRILLDQRQDSRDRDAAIKEAALKPKMHLILWQKWKNELPPDDTLTHYLIFDQEFNENSVVDFIKEFKDTIRFAKLTESDTLSTSENDKKKINSGDYVQWESQGIWQFPQPLKISRFSDDGNFAYFNDSTTGVPVEQLIKVDQSAEENNDKGQKALRPPLIPPIRNQSMNQDTITLKEGQVILQWPPVMSQESYEDYKEWLDLMARRAKRSILAKSEDEGG